MRQCFEVKTTWDATTLGISPDTEKCVVTVRCVYAGPFLEYDTETDELAKALVQRMKGAGFDFYTADSGNDGIEYWIYVKTDHGESGHLAPISTGV